MNYLYSKVEGAEFATNTPERAAFKKHLELVAKALHDIEWVDSCDYARGDENAAILACIGPTPVLQAAIERAQSTQDELKRAIKTARKR